MNKNYRITRLTEENFDQGTRTKAVRTMGGVAKGGIPPVRWNISNGGLWVK